jgi:transcriptional regulator with XRE-family HTH domain
MATLLPDAMVRRLLGARLGVIMQQRDVSQQQLAEHLQLHPSAVSRWCSGERDPNPGQLRSICLLLAIDPALLLGL